MVAMGHGNQRNLWIFRCNNVKILEKSRAARAMELTSSHQNQEFATDNEKSQDPAKMTHPIPDFLSRHGAKIDDPQS